MNQQNATTKTRPPQVALRLLLTAVLVVGLMPLPAFAGASQAAADAGGSLGAGAAALEEPGGLSVQDAVFGQEETHDHSSAVVASYEVGSPTLSDVKATLFGDGCLVFSYEGEVGGSSDTVDYSGVGVSAWNQNLMDNQVKRVEFGDGVEPDSLAYYFAMAKDTYNTSLTTVASLPDTPTNIRSMFIRCTGLTTLPDALPSNAENMQGMFQDCSSLESCPDIPSGVTTLTNTFLRCTRLVSAPAILSSKVTATSTAFKGCTSLARFPANFDLSGVTVAANAFSDLGGTEEQPHVITCDYYDWDEGTNTYLYANKYNWAGSHISIVRGDEEDTGYNTSAPTLSAPADAKAGQNVSLTFADDAGWRTAVKSVLVDGKAVEGYVLSEGTLMVPYQAFLGAGDYSVAVKATGYAPATVAVSVAEDGPFAYGKATGAWAMGAGGLVGRAGGALRRRHAAVRGDGRDRLCSRIRQGAVVRLPRQREQGRVRGGLRAGEHGLLLPQLHQPGRGLRPARHGGQHELHVLRLHVARGRARAAIRLDEHASGVPGLPDNRGSRYPRRRHLNSKRVLRLRVACRDARVPRRCGG